MMVQMKYSNMKIKVFIEKFKIQNYIMYTFYKLFLDPDLTIRYSIPGSIYIISSIALLFVTKYMFHKK